MENVIRYWLHFEFIGRTVIICCKDSEDLKTYIILLTEFFGEWMMKTSYQPTNQKTNQTNKQTNKQQTDKQRAKV